MICPDCNIRLEKVPLPSLRKGSFLNRIAKTLFCSPGTDPFHHACKQCDGRVLTPFQLCQTTDEEYVREIWDIADQGSWLEKRPCPSCRDLSKEVLLSHQNLFLPIDICKRCELIWFDHLEYEELSGIE